MLSDGFALVRRLLRKFSDGFNHPQDNWDLAELLLNLGFREEAKLLFTVCFIRLGFSPSCLEFQSNMASRIGLWSGVEIQASTRQILCAANSETALEELKRLLERPDAAWSSKLQDIAFDCAGDELSNDLHEVDFAPPEVKELNTFCQLCGKLYEMLVKSHQHDDWTNENSLLAQLEAEVLSKPAFEFNKHPSRDVSFLVQGVAFNIFRNFLISNYEIAYAPLGSAELLYETARLETGGLGPYFRNVANLLTSGNDIVGMLQLASASTRSPGLEKRMLAYWSILLSQHLPEGMLRELIEHVADLGVREALWEIAGRIARRGKAAPNFRLLWYIRDAGLDMGDFDLGLKAQQSIVQLRRNDSDELIVLGEIQATLGRFHEAERAFLKGLDINPDHGGGIDRLAALRNKKFEQFEVVGGFGVPLTKTLSRMRAYRAAMQLPGLKQFFCRDIV